jgi:hypothetical protein
VRPVVVGRPPAGACGAVDVGRVAVDVGAVVVVVVVGELVADALELELELEVVELAAVFFLRRPIAGTDGFRNRSAAPTSSCTAVLVDCVPLSVSAACKITTPKND